MSRLTKQLDNGAVTLRKGEAPENIQEALCVLADYEDAKEQGQLVVLKYPIGTTVYILMAYPAYFDPIVKTKISGAAWYPDGWQYATDSCLCVHEKHIGKAVFLTRKEAEAALVAQKEGSVET